VVIGASAGAIEALSAILPALPRDYPLPVMVVVHLPAGKPNLLPELFRDRCQLTVKEAEDKEPIQPGHIYFAAPDYHLLVEGDRKLSLSADEPVLFSRPSIDVLFESAADAYGEKLVGVVLTGASSDGTGGVEAILGRGGQALVQSPETAQSSLMPRSAIERSPSARALRLEQISSFLTTGSHA
jgi:two-component system chemotaxis response regulator CheB